MNKELFDYLQESLQEAVDHTEGKTFLKTTVFKLDSTGRKRVWSIWVDGDETKGIINIEAGLVDGKKVLQTIEITEGKNIGKANATTPYTQAIAEARAKVDLQLRSGYVENVDDAKQAVLGSGLPQCMLAHKYHPTGEQKSSKTLDKIGIRGKKIHVQPKLDGNRCLIKITNDGAVMYTRKGDVMPVQIEDILQECLMAYQALNLTEEIILDGELFSNDLSFNELNGLLKRKSRQHPFLLSKIKYHLYDVMIDKPYSYRYGMLKALLSEPSLNGFDITSIELVPSFEIKATDEAIKEKLEEFLAEGYEGLMIRTLDKGYDNKRSWQLVKVKLFEDAEYKILDLEPDAMGRLGYFIMEMDKPTVDRDGDVVTTFKAGISGIDHEEGKKMLANKHKYIGKMATIEYFGKDVRPRFPKYKGIRQDV